MAEKIETEFDNRNYGGQPRRRLLKKIQYTAGPEVGVKNWLKHYANNKLELLIKVYCQLATT